MSSWAFLRSPRWAGYLALVVVFSIASCALGTWQLNRRTEALTEVARIDANYDAAPVPLDEVVPRLDGFDPDERWQVVEVRGEYLAGEEMVVRNRPLDGSPGFLVVTPMRLDDGSVFVVDRGWIPQAEDGGPSEVPPPPAGRVTATARLKPGEPAIAGRTSTADELATIQLDELAERIGEPTYTGAYGVLVQSGSDAAELPIPAPRPERDEGPHLSYALQWYVFALMAFIGLGWAANQERRALATASGEPPPAPRVPRRRTDADVEDEILDRRR